MGNLHGIPDNLELLLYARGYVHPAVAHQDKPGIGSHVLIDRHIAEKPFLETSRRPERSLQKFRCYNTAFHEDVCAAVPDHLGSKGGSLYGILFMDDLEGSCLDTQLFQHDLDPFLVAYQDGFGESHLRCLDDCMERLVVISSGHRDRFGPDS